MVKDINPSGSSDPERMTVFGGMVLFWASTAVGNEPWRTDGTEAGTLLLKDLNTEAPSSGSDSSPFVVFGSKALFRAAAATTPTDGTGYELFSTNGTTAGTNLVKDIDPGLPGSSPRDITPFGSVALFAADHGTHGNEIWSTNGTAAGTTLVANTAPGSAGSEAEYITDFGTMVLFSGDTPATGRELFRTLVKPAAKTITVVQPNGGESIARGAPYTIKWNHTGSPGTAVKIVLLRGTTVAQTIATAQAIGASGAGQRSWTPPNSLAVGSNYKIRITVNGSSPVVTDMSNAAFSLT